MNTTNTISTTQAINHSQDYFYLRRLGMEYIQNLGSNFWTDYNIHDPGITLLEALCYAITDLGHRTQLPIKDLLAPAPGTIFNPDEQSLFTARNILTTNPWTVADYRKLLIDIKGIKNAWLFCKDCPCDDMFLYLNCDKSELQYTPATPLPVLIKGMYDVLIEFDSGEIDLNNGKVFYNFSFDEKVMVAPNRYTGTIEMRFPSWQKLVDENNPILALKNPSVKITNIQTHFISGNKADDADIQDALLFNRLKNPLYATIEIDFLTDAEDESSATQISMKDIPFSVWLKGNAAKRELTVSDLKNAINESSNGGLVLSYINKLKQAENVMTQSLKSLNNHRNLAEDFCKVSSVGVEDVAVCADMEVSPDADIEQVLATAYFLIEQYMSPNVNFYALSTLLKEGASVDEIFNGPILNSGFIKITELAKSQLKTKLYSSDIINLLMDIPGVLAVNNFTLSGYDEEGFKSHTESWEYDVLPQHQPRLYFQGSKILVFKNSLPFLPDDLELHDSVQMLKGINAAPTFALNELDLKVPEGKYQPVDEVYPVQYQLPQTYGVSAVGLPPQLDAKRHAQAKQLKGYFQLFEQLFVNYLAQLRHMGKNFSSNSDLEQTYFTFLIQESQLNGVSEIYGTEPGHDMSAAQLQLLVEEESTFLDRRNRFLDHVLARFAESFADYALMLYSISNQENLSQKELIKSKVNFLKHYPEMSRNKARAIDYKLAGSVCTDDNVAGLKIRIEKLLGLSTYYDAFEFYEENDDDRIGHEIRWRLKDLAGKIILSSTTRYFNSSKEIAIEMAKDEIETVMKNCCIPESYTIIKEKKWTLNLTDGFGEIIATRKQAFDSEAEAIAARDVLIEFFKTELLPRQLYIVEHLLLRPRNKPSAEIPDGDPLLPVCVSGDCEPCSSDDPYSFRLTIVLSGEQDYGENNMAYRAFAEKTIRQEVPAHLGVKICWVSHEQMLLFGARYCVWLEELSRVKPDKISLNEKLTSLLEIFNNLKSIYPPAFLHDCIDGNDENRVFLNQTII